MECQVPKGLVHVARIDEHWRNESQFELAKAFELAPRGGSIQRFNYRESSLVKRLWGQNGPNLERWTVFFSRITLPETTILFEVKKFNLISIFYI